MVSNESNKDFHFNLGANPSGTLRRNFSFRIRSQAGFDFTTKLDEGHGGPIHPLIIKPGEKNTSWLVLNMWTHLMPPGQYHVHCHAMLSDDLPIIPPPPADRKRQRDAPISIDQDLEFILDAYNKSQIVGAIRKANGDAGRMMSGGLIAASKPVNWALKTIAQQFQTGITLLTGDDAEFEKQVLGALPEKWSERFYAEYDLKFNRNWVNKILPEGLILTFSMRNNSDRPRPLFFRESDLFVNGAKVKGWRQVLGDAMRAGKMSDFVSPGAMVEIPIPFNMFLTRDEVQKIVWSVEGFSKQVEVYLK